MRNWIYTALLAVLSEGVYSNLYIKKHLSRCEQKDRALATRIFYGTLQNWTYLESFWTEYVEKKPGMKAQILLNMSVYQMVFCDKIPSYAILHDAVEIAKKQCPRQAGLINAVLRKVRVDAPNLPEEPKKRLALQTSLPLWLIEMWYKQYGEEKARQMAASSLQILPVYVRRNPLKITKEEFEADPFIENAGFQDSDICIYTGSAVQDHPFYKEGKMTVQDAGSYEIAAFVHPLPGEKILDVCAAPGTKTFAMAEMMEDTGQIDALDLHPHRAQLIEQDKQRLGLHNVHALTHDSTDLSDFGLYDAVLCDVPCSGYGILARKPDMKLHLDSNAMNTLIPLQEQLLEQAASHVLPFGRLVYSTCTLNKKENEKQIQKFLTRHPEFALEEEKTIFPDEKQDGFYMARLTRN